MYIYTLCVVLVTSRVRKIILFILTRICQAPEIEVYTFLASLIIHLSILACNQCYNLASDSFLSRVHTHPCTYTYTHTSVYIHVHTHTCMYTYQHPHTHTHTHIFTQIGMGSWCWLIALPVIHNLR